MIAAGIVLTWLTLAVAAFLTLSALGRVADRHDFEAQLGVLGSEDPAELGHYVTRLRPPGSRPIAGTHRRSSWQPSRRPAHVGLELSRSRSAT
jgi:hypothetical protein